MGFGQGRDLEETRARLAEWARGRLPDAEQVAVESLAAPGNGFSNETLLFELAARRAGVERRERLVARVAPLPGGFQVFPGYDLAGQARVLRRLAPTEIPVPSVRFEEADPRFLGAPFYVMERVEGVIPPDSPPYHLAGACVEMSPERRTAIWWEGLEMLARIHRLDWKAAGLDFLDRAGSASSSLEYQLEDYRRFLFWAARGRPQPLAEAALRWLAEQLPAQEQAALCWGDARLPNMIFQGDRCVAVLDWEMATIGEPEQDLAWWLFLDWHHSTGIGAPRLAGFPSHDETLARCESLLGRPLRNLHYYAVFAAMRFAVIMIRVAQQMARLGLPEPAPDFERNNPCTHRIAELLKLPPPGPRIGQA
jgi:aminoglycoside phosphotransferase (APT) family kinase protein